MTAGDFILGYLVTLDEVFCPETSTPRQVDVKVGARIDYTKRDSRCC